MTSARLILALAILIAIAVVIAINQYQTP